MFHILYLHYLRKYHLCDTILCNHVTLTRMFDILLMKIWLTLFVLNDLRLIFRILGMFLIAKHFISYFEPMTENFYFDLHSRKCLCNISRTILDRAFIVCIYILCGKTLYTMVFELLTFEFDKHVTKPDLSALAVSMSFL